MGSKLSIKVKSNTETCQTGDIESKDRDFIPIIIMVR